MKTIAPNRRYLNLGRSLVAGNGNADRAYVPETSIGFCFLGTETWRTHVISVALGDLERLIPPRRKSYAVILDAGCGQGLSFRPLIKHFSPERIVAVDAEEKCGERARVHAASEHVPIARARGDVSALDLPDLSVDLVFC